MNKKYIFNTEAEAEGMIISLATVNEEGETPNFRQVRGTEFTNGIVVLGFQDERIVDEETGAYVIDEETGEVSVIEGTTFNVDISWKVLKKKNDVVDEETGETIVADNDAFDAWEEALEFFSEYEVHPTSSNHNFL